MAGPVDEVYFPLIGKHSFCWDKGRSNVLSSYTLNYAAAVQRI